MKFYKFRIIEKFKEVEDTYIIRAICEDGKEVFTFKPGQYSYIIDPSFKVSDELHPFSIASSPYRYDYIEFCIKQLGDWTKHFIEDKKDEAIYVSEPQGKFTLGRKVGDAVFLLGGIGISPIMSILRTLVMQKTLKPKIKILYGNRTPYTIAYKEELDELEEFVPNLEVINIFSDIEGVIPKGAYKGFITDTIVKKEVDLTRSPKFFVVGPPIFLTKMDQLLSSLHIPSERIKKEELNEKSIVSDINFIRR